MKLKQLLTKTLLVAAGLLTGASAWSGETWDFTNSTIWGSITLPSESNSYADVSYDASGAVATTGNFITFHSSTGKIKHATTQTDGFGWDTEGSTSDHYVKMSVPAGSTVTVLGYFSTNRTIGVTFNGSTTTLKSASGWVDVSQDFINDTGESKDLYIYCNANAGGAGTAPFLKKISLKQTVVVTTTYKDELGNTIKANKVENVETGTTYSPSYDATYYVSNTDPYTYTYKEGAPVSPETITEAKTYNIVYTKSDRPSYKLNVTQSYGGKSKKLINDQTIYQGARPTYYYPRYLKDGNKLYKYASSSDANADGTYWYSTLSSVTANVNVTLTYNRQDNICVFYTEAEDVEGFVQYDHSTFNPRSSGGKNGVLDEKTITTLEAGSYSIYARAIGKANTEKVYKESASSDDNLILSFSCSTTGVEDHADFVLTASTNIIAKGGYKTTSENGHGFDYFFIMRTATDVEKAIMDCEDYETSEAFATYIEGGSYSTAAEVYAAHTAWQIEQAKASSSTDLTKIILNAGVASTANWTNSRVIELASEVSNVAPDNFLIDANNQVLDTYQIVYGLPAGKYTVKAATRATAACESGKIYVYAEGQVDKNAEGNHVGNTGGDLDHGWSWTSIDFELTATSDVKFGYYVDATSSKWASCDDWHLTLAGVPVTISSLDYATFASDYDLDFNSLSSTLKAYKATVSGSTITFKAVTTVPAREGVLLKSVTGLDADQTFDIPVTSGVAAWAADDNAFVRGANVAVPTTTDSDNHNYVLSTKGGVLGFYKASDKVVPSSKAYLQTTIAAARIAINFDDETTGIENLTPTLSQGEGAIYDLQGRKVAQPTKGLYIVNGKKVIIK